MADFPAAIDAQLGGRLVRCGILVRFDFPTGAVRLWNGARALRTNDGYLWSGLRVVGDISGLGQSVNGAAAPLDLTVSGVDADFAAKVKGDRANWYDAVVIVFWQFFDESWQPLDLPMPFRFAQLKTMTASRSWDDSNMRHVYTVSVRAEGPFINNRRPRHGFYTDADQKARSPGDRFFDRVAGIEGRVINWP
ncbi:hypothetical protein NVS89_22465 [Ancylobacter sp. MQZ15Z-1]|uniref:Uncharacterized protein n=1 Tax=Ancylobacter mangrovi TaxID=2972472 RepID=A0A9X2T954_9HYPH|nr:hypothetical protein [Ancylobacter mangrovi]MCS0497858.1 hypothetical protein [Ancylobacter mangrovi]